MRRCNAILYRFLKGFRQPSELSDIQKNPAPVGLAGFLRNQNNLGLQDACISGDAAAWLGDNPGRTVTEVLHDGSPDRLAVILEGLYVLAIVCREPSTDIQKFKFYSTRAEFGKNHRCLLDRDIPLPQLPLLRANMKRHACRTKPAFGGLTQQLDRQVRIAAEFA